MVPSPYYLARTVATCALCSFLGALVFTGGPLGSWGLIFRGTAAATAFSSCCALLCVIVLPRLVPYVRRRFSAPVGWLLLIAAMVGLAAAGSAIPILMLGAIGYLPAKRLAFEWIEPLKISIYFTLLFGVSGTVIGELRQRLNQTSLALRTKERDEAEAKRLAVEAQLASLESRVQPHFLFNTLNSIAALIVDDPAAAERMTGQLATLLRSSLDQHSPLVSLDDELRIVRSYLEIERVRFGDRLRYDIAVDEAARYARVPQLSVQTIVENSVKYAVSPRREGASIAVRAAATNGHVRIEVADDGPGFDAATALPGHGLALVRDRLAMSLGDRARLDVDSRPGRTTVIISLPANPEARIPNPEATR